jgi:hypothetical protein
MFFLGSDEDREATEMLVGNAQNLMQSVSLANTNFTKNYPITNSIKKFTGQRNSACL